MTYEEANWPKLSPAAREVHNRLRQVKGLPPIPSPVNDLYVPPKAPKIRPFDSKDPEVVAAIREGLGPQMMGGGREGFTINGQPAGYSVSPAEDIERRNRAAYLESLKR
jgi:hypothetical protein